MINLSYSKAYEGASLPILALLPSSSLTLGRSFLRGGDPPVQSQQLGQLLDKAALLSAGCSAGVGAGAAVMLPAPADLFGAELQPFRACGCGEKLQWLLVSWMSSHCWRQFRTQPSTGKAGVSLCELVLTRAMSTFQGGEAES